MYIVSATEARNNLSAMIERAKKEPVIIQKQGENAAVLVSYEEFKNETAKSAGKFKEVCERIRLEAKNNGLTDELFDQIMAEDD